MTPIGTIYDVVVVLAKRSVRLACSSRLQWLILFQGQDLEVAKLCFPCFASWSRMPSKSVVLGAWRPYTRLWTRSTDVRGIPRKCGRLKVAPWRLCIACNACTGSIHSKVNMSLNKSQFLRSIMQRFRLLETAPKALQAALFQPSSSSNSSSNCWIRIFSPSTSKRIGKPWL